MNNEHSSYPDFPEDEIVAKLQKEICSLREQVKELEQDLAFLDCLRSAGVDNWSG